MSNFCRDSLPILCGSGEGVKKSSLIEGRKEGREGGEKNALAHATCPHGPRICESHPRLKSVTAH